MTFLIIGLAALIGLVLLELWDLSDRLDEVLKDPVRQIEREHQRIVAEMVAAEAEVREQSAER